MSVITERLIHEFSDEDYRYAYDEAFANSLMATQIKVIREQRGYTQSQLAELAEMKQSRISTLENVNYDAWSISTLRRIARALGVRLVYKFEGWGELLPEIDDFNRKWLEKPSFEEDPVFQTPADQVVARLTADIQSTANLIPLGRRQVRHRKTTTSTGQFCFSFVTDNVLPFRPRAGDQGHILTDNSGAGKTITLNQPTPVADQQVA